MKKDLFPSKTFRKLAIASLVFLFPFWGNGQELLLFYDFEDKVSPEIQNENIAASDVSISSGTIIFQNGSDEGGTKIGNSGSWNQKDFDPSGKYLEFSLTPEPGFLLEELSLTLRFGRTNAGPTRITVHYSLDDFYSEGIPLLENEEVSSENVNDLDTFSLPAGVLPSDPVFSRITFRIWGHNAPGTGNLRFNNFRVFGQTSETALCDPAGLFFRTRKSGYWNNALTWESSSSETGDWIIGPCLPEPSSNQVSILPEHAVTFRGDNQVNQLFIQGSLILPAGEPLILEEGPGDELTIDNGGILIFNGGKVPDFSNGNVRVRVLTGGTIRVDNGISGISDSLAGNKSENRIIYETGGIFNWNNGNSFSTSGQIYFPGAEENVVPIFKVPVNTGNVGAGNPTLINGLFEANGNVTWQNAGEKTFRNGITGSGNVTQSGTSGKFVISGDAALMGGTGELILNTDGLEIAGENTTLVTDKSISGAGPLIISGSLQAGDHTLTLESDLIIENSGSFLPNTSTVVFNGPGYQFIQTPIPANFHNLTTDKPGGELIINNNITLSGTLLLLQGHILTENNTLIISNPTEDGIMGHSENAYIKGNLTRTISDNHIFDFPMGNEFYQLATVIFEEKTGGITQLEAGFHPLEEPLDISALGLTVNTSTLHQLLDGGYWTIVPVGMVVGDLEYAITLNLAGSENAGDHPGQHSIVKRTNPNEDWMLEGDHFNEANELEGNRVTAKRFNLTSFSDFAIAKNDFGPLPVDLLSFNATLTAEQVLIAWSTASETNNDFFTLERSQDTRVTQAIATIPGAGNSNQVLTYQHNDPDPLEGISYYRLKQTDFDGTVEYFPWVAIEYQPGADGLGVKVLRRPEGNLLHILSGNSGQVEVRFTDLYGRTLMQTRFLSGEAGHPQKLVPIDPAWGSMILYRISNGRQTISGKAPTR